MEKVAYELSQHLAKLTDVKLVKWGGSNKWLPLVLPYLLFCSSWILLTAKVSVVYVEDGLLAPLGVILELFRKPVAITIHGKDITYKNTLYQFLIPRLVGKLDKIICVSDATKQQCINRGIFQRKVVVIPNGISDEFHMNAERQQLKERLSKELGIRLDNRKVILSVGRLVERKGVHWFVENVMPLLIRNNSPCVYLIAGDGNFSSQIKEIIRRNNLNEYVFMLGRVGEETLRLLYNAADIFVMPNIPVKGDMEGFGLVALEAASCGLPVVASNLEGIREAIVDGKNGFLVEPANAQGFTERIKELLENDELRERLGAQARQFTLENYGWARVAGRYLKSFVTLTDTGRK